MKNLSSAELLEVWERGQGQSPVRKALLLLAAAFPEVGPQALAEMSIGQRDGYLLTLREWLFGPQLVSIAACPRCGERLELNFSTSDIRAQAEIPAEPFSLKMVGYELEFRLPNSLDLLNLSSGRDLTTTRQTLLERCLLKASFEGEAASVGQIPAEVVEAIAGEMARSDPQADVQLALECAACQHQWQAGFDIVSFLWDELNAWAYRLLQEVHLLAKAYGWREADILALTPWRRQFYLDRVTSS